MVGFGSWWGMDYLRGFEAMYPTLPHAGKVALIAILLWTVISISLHELAHGWTAIRCGDDTPRLLGHMTLDPIKHMGLAGLVALALTGYSWGAMPVNASNLRRRHDDALVAFAGPLTNVLLALLCVGGLVLSAKMLQGDAKRYGFIVFLLGFSQNIRLAIFNMFPVPPLDGSRIAASFIPGMRNFVYSPGAAVVGLIFVLTIAPRLINPAEGWVVEQTFILLRSLGWL